MKRKIWISKNNSNLTHAISFKALKAVFLYCQMLGLQSYMVAQEINFKKEKKLTKVLRTRKTWCSNNTNFTSIQPFDHSYYVLVRRFLCFHLYIYFFQTHPKKDEKFRLHLLPLFLLCFQSSCCCHAVVENVSAFTFHKSFHTLYS